MKLSTKIKKIRMNIVNISNRIDELNQKRQNRIYELQQLCKHEYISEYSRGNDYSRVDLRICEICTFEEKNIGTGYSILKNDRIKKIGLTELSSIRKININF